MKFLRPLTVVALGAALSTAAIAAPMMMNRPLGTPTTIHMKAQNGSGQIGTATLRDVSGAVQVELHIANVPAGAAEPAHIHLGSCAVLNPHPYLVLSNVVNGNSTTLITSHAIPGGVTVAKLLRGHYAINVHDAKNLKRYVSCGNL
jgi:hypothetical protein